MKGGFFLNPKYMKRAIELAKKGIGYTNPNPIVGCVVVKNDKIIAEGYHKKQVDFTQNEMHLQIAKKIQQEQNFM